MSRSYRAQCATRSGLPAKLVVCFSLSFRAERSRPGKGRRVKSINLSLLRALSRPERACCSRSFLSERLRDPLRVTSAARRCFSLSFRAERSRPGKGRRVKSRNLSLFHATTAASHPHQCSAGLSARQPLHFAFAAGQFNCFVGHGFSRRCLLAVFFPRVLALRSPLATAFSSRPFPASTPFPFLTRARMPSRISQPC